jgi:hypothetical protein
MLLISGRCRFSNFFDVFITVGSWGAGNIPDPVTGLYYWIPLHSGSYTIHNYPIINNRSSKQYTNSPIQDIPVSEKNLARLCKLRRNSYEI